MAHMTSAAERRQRMVSTVSARQVNAVDMFCEEIQRELDRSERESGQSFCLYFMRAIDPSMGSESYADIRTRVMQRLAGSGYTVLNPQPTQLLVITPPAECEEEAGIDPELVQGMRQLQTAVGDSYDATAAWAFQGTAPARPDGGYRERFPPTNGMMLSTDSYMMGVMPSVGGMSGPAPPVSAPPLPTGSFITPRMVPVRTPAVAPQDSGSRARVQVAGNAGTPAPLAATAKPRTTRGAEPDPRTAQLLPGGPSFGAPLDRRPLGPLAYAHELDRNRLFAVGGPDGYVPELPSFGTPAPMPPATRGALPATRVTPATAPPKAGTGDVQQRASAGNVRRTSSAGRSKVSIANAPPK